MGLIGTGFGATVQAPGFRCVEGAELKAVASAHAERARAVAGEFGIDGAYGDYREMLATEHLDVVSVVTPPHLHHEMTLAALRIGCHVLCEKPFAMNTGQAVEMLEEAEQLGRVHAVDHEFRFIPARAAMKRLLEAGEIGEVVLVRILDVGNARRSRTYTWWSDRSRGGGLLGAVGSHYIDALRWWLGPIARVDARLQAVVRELPDEEASIPREVTADDTALLSARLENGVPVRIDLSSVLPAAGRRAEVIGTRGSLILEGTKLYEARDGEQKEVPLEAGDQARLDDPRLGPFVELAQRFVDRVNGKDSGDFPTFADGVAVQRILDAIHRSADEAREVRVTEIA